MLIPTVGGKEKQAKWIENLAIKSLVESGLITTYAEPFSRSMWVYHKTSIYKHVYKVIYNDIDKFVANTAYVIKNKKEKLIKELKKLEPANNKTFNKFRDLIFEKVANGYNFNMGNVKLATAYVYTKLHVRSGFALSKNTKLPKGVDTRKLDSFIRKLEGKSHIKNLDEKLEKITAINNKDYKEILKKYDSESTLFYLDPPYYNKENFYEFGNFDKEEHKRMAEMVKKLKGYVIISYYEFEGIKELYPENEFYYFYKDFYRPSSNNKSKGREVLILNYDPQTLEKVKKVKKTNTKRKTKIKSVNNKDYKTDELIELKKEIKLLNKQIKKISNEVKSVNCKDYKNKNTFISKFIKNFKNFFSVKSA